MPPVSEYDLERFVSAHSGGTYERALSELRSGRKTSHWMWFIFPQIAGLGRSEVAKLYAISSLAEARAYIRHPVLGQRLVESAQALVELQTSDPELVMGGIDAVKLRSSMTLFAHAAPDEPVFRRVLEKYFGGEPDSATERRLSA